MSIVSVPKIYRFGERWTNGILEGPIVVEEKYDGSQFTFGVVEGELVCRSKSTIIDRCAPGMFSAACGVVERLQDVGLIEEGWLYFCEFLAKPKHNVLNYARVPNGFLVLYDAFSGPHASNPNQWLSPGGKSELAAILGLEFVRVLFSGETDSFAFQELLPHWMAEESSLGGPKVEGVVIKNYGKPHGERGTGWPQTAKIVSEAFKEKQTLRPRNPKPGPDEFVQRLVNSLRTEARWLKAVQHLREAGKLEGASKDIGLLYKEVQTDILAEETEWIKQQLFDEFSKGIVKGTVHGLAQWYQNKLANGWSVFEETELCQKTNC